MAVIDFDQETTVLHPLATLGSTTRYVQGLGMEVTQWPCTIGGVFSGVKPWDGRPEHWGRTVRCARAVRKVGCSPPPGVR